jgi:uncharacterized protein YcbK (DUF882 family)
LRLKGEKGLWAKALTNSSPFALSLRPGEPKKTNTRKARLIFPKIALARLTAATPILRRAKAHLGRRLCAAALGLLAVLAPNALESAAANGDTRTIFLYHAHRKEAIAATFRVNGHYDPETLAKLNWFLRDWRNDEETKMDPRLFDVIWEVYRSAERMGPDDPIVVMSAYRCPATNAMLRRRSRSVAEHSQHMLGKAMDTSIPSMSMEKIREIGMRMQRGGVGYYPNAGTPFVHLDVGGVRHWPRMNYDQLVRLFPDGKTVHIPSNGKPMERYEEARAEILARGGEAATMAEATQGGGIFGFFSRLFGGGEDEEESRLVAAAPRPTRVASARAEAPSESVDNSQRRLVASAEADLPRGETYLGASEQPGPGRQAVTAQEPPRPEPAPVAAPAKAAASDEPTPEPAEEAAAPADVPAPPRRPDNLLASEDAPLPPPRPAEYAKLPEIITHGTSLGLRNPAAEPAALAYAAPASIAIPTPPPRPSMRPLRPAAEGKAEEQRAAKAAAAASEMTPARLDRAAIVAAAAPTRQSRAGASGSIGFAPALRSAAKLEVIAATPPAHAPKGAFGAWPRTSAPIPSPGKTIDAKRLCGRASGLIDY